MRSALSSLGLLLLGACKTLSPAPESARGACNELGTLCPSCTQAATREQCDQASASGDEVQCAAILSQPAIQVDCAASEAGAEGGVDAAALPECGAVAAGDASCACSGDCAPACPAGGCAVVCASGTCAPSCAGGACTVRCEQGATCQGSCAGGACRFDCVSGSTCANSCGGGGCAFQCEVGSVCSDTCDGAVACTGF